MTTSLFILGEIYHVYNRANGNENLFRSEENYIYFLRKYYEYLHPLVETFAYCLMPNHFHFMIRIREVENLLEDVDLRRFEEINVKDQIGKQVAQKFSNFLNGYTKAYNKRYNRKGSLFQQNTKRKLVDDESYFTGLIHYIHFNPVKHGFCKNIDDWDFSSFKEIFNNIPTKLSVEHVYEWFGGRPSFIKFHRFDADPFE